MTTQEFNDIKIDDLVYYYDTGGLGSYTMGANGINIRDCEFYVKSIEGNWVTIRCLNKNPKKLTLNDFQRNCFLNKQDFANYIYNLGLFTIAAADLKAKEAAALQELYNDLIF